MQIRVLAFVFIFVAGAAHAQATGDASAELARCAAIADSAARLKCFDAAASRASGAAAQPAAKAAPGQAERVENFGRPQPPPKVTRFTATVIELARTLRGRALFILDNGQVWRQLDGDDAYVLDPVPGKTMKVAIEMSFVQSLLGGYSYKLTVEGRNGFIRVYRLQ